ncbi:MAG: hypothetical protein ACRDRD_11640 [Pseudonocardiaceae bacterium]
MGPHRLVSWLRRRFCRHPGLPAAQWPAPETRRPRVLRRCPSCDRMVRLPR